MLNYQRVTFGCKVQQETASKHYATEIQVFSWSCPPHAARRFHGPRATGLTEFDSPPSVPLQNNFMVYQGLSWFVMFVYLVLNINFQVWEWVKPQTSQHGQTFLCHCWLAYICKSPFHP